MKKIYVIFSLCLILSPSLVWAKSAPITVVTNAIETAEKEMEKYQEDLELVTEVKMMINSARDELNNLKEEAKQKAMSYALSQAQKGIAKNKTLSGIAKKMNFGDFATAGAREAYQDKYVFKSDSKNDVEEKAAYDEKMNELLINNVSAMYAQALVKRYELQKEGAKIKEDEEKQNDIKDETIMINTVKEVKMRANKRWINILISMAGAQNNEANIEMQKLTQTSDDEQKTEGEAQKGE